jgi:hypothetical protein
VCRAVFESGSATALVVERSASWHAVANPLGRPHRDRNRPYCVRVVPASTNTTSAPPRPLTGAVCFAPAWPTATRAVEALLAHAVVAPGDAVLLSGLVADS